MIIRWRDLAHVGTDGIQKKVPAESGVVVLSGTQIATGLGYEGSLAALISCTDHN